MYPWLLGFSLVFVHSMVKAAEPIRTPTLSTIASQQYCGR